MAGYLDNPGYLGRFSPADIDPTPAPLMQMAAGGAPQYAKASPYQTQLSPGEESSFRHWVRANNIPFDHQETHPDYDMRGFWKGLVTGDPRAATAINASDGRIHFTDTWKTPYHQTFSNESMYAGPMAPEWKGNDKEGWNLIGSDGSIIHSEIPAKK